MEQAALWQQVLEQALRREDLPAMRRAISWRTAMGLQDVDGLEPSPFLNTLALSHAQGTLALPALQKKLARHYRGRKKRQEALESGFLEADLVSAHLVEQLDLPDFTFSVPQLLEIHRALFSGVLEAPGQFRPYNIRKDEWVLNGDTVVYAPCQQIPGLLKALFEREVRFPWDQCTLSQQIRHAAAFTARLWRIHAFQEGNTRTTAVFLLRYLESMGLPVYMDVFTENSWYFRNALVRANYRNSEKGIEPTDRYLQIFFTDLLTGSIHNMRSRDLHIPEAEGTAD